MPATSMYPLILKSALVDLPGLGNQQQIVTAAIREAVRRFLLRSEAWQYKLTALDLTADTVAYTITPDAYEADIRRILSVRILTEQEVTDGLEGTVQDESDYEFTPPTTLTLDDSIEPQESITDGLVVTVVLVPKVDSTVEVPEELARQWFEAIRAYTLWILKTQTNKPWSDAAGAKLALIEVNRGVAQARSDMARGFKVGEGLEA